MSAEQDLKGRKLSFKEGNPPTTIEKFIIPQGVENLMVELHLEENVKEYASSCECFKCNQPLPLQDLKFEWPVGPFVFCFPRVPGYQCQKCDEMYFPEMVLSKVSELAEKELIRLAPQPRFKNPDAIKFNRSGAQMPLN